MRDAYEQVDKIQYGQFFTVVNPFNLDVFYKWASFFKDNVEVFLEPFAGANNIVKMIKDLGFRQDWKCFDIQPISKQELNGYIVEKRDTLLSYPQGYDVAITNPPYLAKNSATKKNLSFPNTCYDDLYKVALDTMLQYSKYVAAIIPESFLTSDLFHDRLYAVVSLTCKMFADTDCPVCLALFIPEEKNRELKLGNDFQIYKQNKYINTYKNIKNKIPTTSLKKIDWKFNDKQGSIGIRCIDNTTEPTICFVDGDNISNDKIKVSSRSITKVSGLPSGIDKDTFISKCNKVLNEYRISTHDVLLTSFKGLRKDNQYRRRLDFKTAKEIMNCSLDILVKEGVVSFG